jgi:hypothetical protein
MTKIKFLKNKALNTVSYLCIILFVYAAFSKWLDFGTFQNQLGQSPLLSAYADIIVWALPISEIVIASFLCFKKSRDIGLYSFYFLMIMFTTYIIIILKFTSYTPCSCGGVLEKLGWIEHLYFNLAFIILSALSILHLSSNKKSTYIKLLLLMGIGSLVICIIFLSSEKQIKQNNAFIRRYMPHPIEKIGEYDLKFNSYYIAGVDDDSIYLGNYTTPLYVTTFDYALKKINEFQIEIDSMHLPYKRVRISMNSPYVFVGDGTVPVIFKGTINSRKASLYSFHDAYFTEFLVADSNTIGITTKSIKTKSTALGKINKLNESIKFYINDEILIKEMDGSFDSDGLFLWNNFFQKFIYTYYYRNKFVVADKNLNKIKLSKTIDTISNPILDIAYYSKSNHYKLGSKSVMVNRQSSTDGNYLYINSDRLGKYENDEVLKFAKIIDVYDLRDDTYAFSFYLYHQPKGKLQEFKIYKDVLVAIIDDQLWLYRLKPEYFEFVE